SKTGRRWADKATTLLAAPDANVVLAQDIDGSGECGVLLHFVGYGPVVGWIMVVGGNDLNMAVAVFFECFGELDVVICVPAPFVAAAEIVDMKAVLLSTIEPGDRIANVIVGPESSPKPTGCSPGQSI